MKARYLTFLGLFSLALTALNSCSDAIFATVETATKTATNTLPLTLNIYDIAVTSAGNYYVGAGGVFQGILTGSFPGTVAWNPNINNTSRPFNPNGAACNALALFPGTNLLYGGFAAGGGNVGLFQSDFSNGAYSFGAGHGTQITSTAAPGEQVTLLRTANTYLFMGGATPTSTNFQYELDFSNTPGTTWTAAITGLAYPITGVSWDGLNYWAASSPFGLYSTSINSSAILYTSPNPPTNSSFSVLATNPVPSGDQINGIFSDSVNNRTFLATRQNGIYWTSNGGASWNHISPDQQGSTTVSYLCVTGPVDNPPSDKYLVGSDGFGYYTLSISGNNLSRFGDSTILLYTSSVSRIAWDSGTSNALMGTNVNGLWRGTFDYTGALASGQSWVHE